MVSACLWRLLFTFYCDQEADFAIGDITVLTTRDRFVDFSLAFMEFGLSAVLRKEVLESSKYPLKSFKDLSEQTDIAYGVKKYGANLPLFPNDPVIAKMYSYMDTHPSAFVTGEREGLEKVKSERYAFIVESPFVEYVVQRDCTLAAIDDRRKHFQFEYAIAVRKGSPLRKRFSKAISQLRSRGRLRELREKYWRSFKCNPLDDSTRREVENISPDKPNEEDEEINFADKDKLQEETNRGNKDALVKSDDYRRKPHDVVDEDDIELIKPKQDNKKRPIQPGGRNPPRSGTNTVCPCDSPLVLVCLLLAFCSRFNW